MNLLFNGIADGIANRIANRIANGVENSIFNSEAKCIAIGNTMHSLQCKQYNILIQSIKYNAYNVMQKNNLHNIQCIEYIAKEP